MADDMKKLVEKYKRELMEYSRISSSEKPSPLYFPEMTAYSPKEVSADDKPTAQAVNKTAEIPAIKPKPEPTTPVMGTAADVPGQGVISTPENNADKIPFGNDNIRDFSAENTDRLSASGQSPDVFENTPETRNPRSDIKPLETQTNGTHEMQPEREYTDIRDFNNINNKRGTLRFRVYTAREALPVSGALIEITKVIGNSKHTFYKLTTDISGNTPVIYLPAPSSELSQHPENTIQPYALYDAYITADNFGDVSIKDLPIFDGILSEQSIAMVPTIAATAGAALRRITENGPIVNGGVY